MYSAIEHSWLKGVLAFSNMAEIPPLCEINNLLNLNTVACKADIHTEFWVRVKRNYPWWFECNIKPWVVKNGFKHLSAVLNVMYQRVMQTFQKYYVFHYKRSGEKNIWHTLQTLKLTLEKEHWKELERDHMCLLQPPAKKREKIYTERIESLEILMIPGQVSDT